MRLDHLLYRESHKARNSHGVHTYRVVELTENGGLAQLGERVLCKHEVIGSIPLASTIFFAMYLQKFVKVCIISNSYEYTAEMRC